MYLSRKYSSTTDHFNHLDTSKNQTTSCYSRTPFRRMHHVDIVTYAIALPRLFLMPPHARPADGTAICGSGYSNQILNRSPVQTAARNSFLALRSTQKQEIIQYNHPFGTTRDKKCNHDPSLPPRIQTLDAGLFFIRQLKP